MRPGQHNKRSRGRSRHRGSSSGGGGGGNPLSRVYESNGPDVKVRGTAQTIAEKYLQLGRDAQSSGDIVMAESYNQHAEHYLRIVAAAQAYNQQLQQQYRKPGEEYEDDEGEDAGDAEGEDGGPLAADQPDQPAMQAEQPFDGDRPQQPYQPQQQHRQRDRDQSRDRKPRWENRRDRDHGDQPRESHGEQRSQVQPRDDEQPPVQAEPAAAEASGSGGGNWEAPSFLRKPSPANGSGRQRYERRPRKESAPEAEAAGETAPEPVVVDAPQGE